MSTRTVYMKSVKKFRKDGTPYMATRFVKKGTPGAIAKTYPAKKRQPKMSGGFLQYLLPIISSLFSGSGVGGQLKASAENKRIARRLNGTLLRDIFNRTIPGMTLPLKAASKISSQLKKAFGEAPQGGLVNPPIYSANF